MSLKLVTLLAYTVALPAGVGLFFFKLIPKPLKTLTVLFVVGTLFEILATLFRMAFKNNLLVINAYVIAETLLILVFVAQCIRGHRKIILACQAVTIAVGVYESLLAPNSFNSILSTLESIFSIGGIIFIFTQVTFGKNINRHVFFMAGTLLFYFVTNAVYFGVRKFLDMDSLIFVSIIHVWINALSNIIYALILWQSRSRSLLFA